MFSGSSGLRHCLRSVPARGMPLALPAAGSARPWVPASPASGKCSPGWGHSCPCSAGAPRAAPTLAKSISTVRTPLVWGQRAWHAHLPRRAWLCCGRLLSGADSRPHAGSWGRGSGVLTCELGPLSVFSLCPVSAPWCWSAFMQLQLACPHVTSWAWLPPVANHPAMLQLQRPGDIPLPPLPPAPLLPLGSPRNQPQAVIPLMSPSPWQCPLFLPL